MWDFVGYAGTVALLVFKEYWLTGIDWSAFYNHINLYIGLICCLAFVGSIGYIMKRKAGKAFTVTPTANPEYSLN